MNFFEVVEEVLLIVTYTILVVTLFVEYVCYKRKLENIETILFTVSLLFLIVSLSVSPFFTTKETLRLSELFKLLSFVCVTLATPLNVFAERAIEISKPGKRALFGLSFTLSATCLFDYFFQWNSIVRYVIVAFLAVSVVGSMIVLLSSKPIKKSAYKERIDKWFAIAFIILVPLSLVVNYFFDIPELKIGMTLPIIFILLAGNKLLDDIQRLSLLSPKIEPNQQALQGYQLTERENEIAFLLIQGKTYRQISEQLFISIPTVKTHSGNIYRKCGVNSRAKLMALNFS